MQRLLDIVISGLSLLFLLPLLLPVVVVLRLTGEGEIFFQQERVGAFGKPFLLLKFATMLKDSPNMGTGTVTIKDDPRVLPVGRLLRSTKINELPQLINVLLGDMSIVGPRPQAQRCFDVFPSHLQRVIVRVKPGLSGLGSIVFRAEEDILADRQSSISFYDDVIAPYKGLIEVWYVERATLVNYFKVILVTLWVVVFPKTSAVWNFFEGLPEPPEDLKGCLRYPYTVV